MRMHACMQRACAHLELELLSGLALRSFSAAEELDAADIKPRVLEAFSLVAWVRHEHAERSAALLAVECLLLQRRALPPPPR